MYAIRSYYGVNENVKNVLKNNGIENLLGSENICSNINEAIEKSKLILSRITSYNVCYTKLLRALMIRDDRVAGVAELMNYPGVYSGVKSELDKIEAGKGKAIDFSAMKRRKMNMPASVSPEEISDSTDRNS